MTIIRSNISRADVRRAPRKPTAYPAWIDLGDGAPPRLCRLSDVSEIGAKLALEGADTLPERFTLLLALTMAAPKRDCRAVWRSPQEIGVSFVHGRAETASPSIAPAEPATAPAGAADTTELDC